MGSCVRVRGRRRTEPVQHYAAEHHDDHHRQRVRLLVIGQGEVSPASTRAKMNNGDTMPSW
jgi:hypothetical protein